MSSGVLRFGQRTGTGTGDHGTRIGEGTRAGSRHLQADPAADRVGGGAGRGGAGGIPRRCLRPGRRAGDQGGKARLHRADRRLALIIAKEKGLFAKHGLPDMDVLKQASWGATRDNMVLGSEANGIDGAHILSPMPYLISTGKVTQNASRRRCTSWRG
jgi:hypothetical protein